MYHCVKFHGYLVEVCSPKSPIVGQYCAVFEEGLGRVIVDLYTSCPECPMIYSSAESWNYSKCVETILKTTTYQTYQTPKYAAETNHSKGNSAIMNENNDISTVTVTSAENKILTTSGICKTEHTIHKYAIVFAIIFIMVLVGLLVYYKRKRRPS